MKHLFISIILLTLTSAPQAHASKLGFADKDQTINLLIRFYGNYPHDQPVDRWYRSNLKNLPELESFIKYPLSSDLRQKLSAYLAHPVTDEPCIDADMFTNTQDGVGITEEYRLTPENSGGTQFEVHLTLRGKDGGRAITWQFRNESNRWFINDLLYGDDTLQKALKSCTLTKK